jgi:hypothetical protein
MGRDLSLFADVVHDAAGEGFEVDVGQIEGIPVSDDLDRFARGIDQNRTRTAMGGVLLEVSAHLDGDLIFEIAADFGKEI